MRWGIIREVVNMAFESLRSHKLRSFLTVLGITIGVLTVIGMVSIIQGLNKSFLRELESAGSDLIIVSKYKPIQVGRRSEEERKRKDLTYEDALAIEKECPSVKAVAVDLIVNIWQNPVVKYRNIKSKDTLVIGINERWPEVVSVYLPKEGRFFTRAEVTHKAQVCLLGYETAEILFPHSSPIGKEIRIGNRKFKVVGVASKRGEIFGQSRDNFVAIPITTLMKHFPYKKENIEILAIPVEHELMFEAIEEITNVLRKRRKVPVGEENDFEIYTQDTILDLYNQITGAAYLVMIVISSIGLLVGGIGVMNIMLVSVKERTREIGIRKAIGARNSDILTQFLIEAIFLTGTGGLIGIFFGFMIALLVKALTPLPASITLWSVALGFFVSISVGLFFGVFPARKAAKLDPIVALRYE
ncbi:ABC transporter permease [Candidatus Aminicenantes bacterium AC-708-M15]|jgi:putative ABC transport system permease protein|nr:ABC transporter permease [SCandidatus Aminicenantes bacterium Aminicenantia_JdfR_composite]MCP2598511.1 ABC transporter permease [Candidatus Aminicenantes bacterium AC-335-L06]MCP2604263.1 ABC transporter permease [Candidatus Aminicenantes bacterium AC-708-M15]MCP2620791.1 ABC transporter permease [Candidatus Aminicenantes bacterium AC-334-E05]